MCEPLCEMCCRCTLQHGVMSRSEEHAGALLWCLQMSIHMYRHEHRHLQLSHNAHHLFLHFQVGHEDGHKGGGKSRAGSPEWAARMTTAERDEKQDENTMKKMQEQDEQISDLKRRVDELGMGLGSKAEQVGEAERGKGRAVKQRVCEVQWDGTIYIYSSFWVCTVTRLIFLWAEA